MQRDSIKLTKDRLNREPAIYDWIYEKGINAKCVLLHQMSCDFVNSKGLKNTPSDEKKKENKKEHEEEDKRVKQEWRGKKKLICV